MKILALILAAASLVAAPFNVKELGALGDNSTDDYAAIQATIDAACLTTVDAPGERGAVVYFPGSKPYRIGRPLTISCSNLKLEGEGYASRIKPFYTYGPAFVVHPSIATGGYIAVPTVPGITASGGLSMKIGGGDYFLNLRDAQDIDGLVAITIEFFLKLDALSEGAILSSYGRRTTLEPATEAFYFGTLNTGQWFARLNVGGVSKSLSGAGNLAPGVLYHVALVYDGAEARLYLNGALQSTTAATGSIVQALTENMSVGPRISHWPDGEAINPAVSGAIDSIRLSNVARYTAAFTAPTTKLAFPSGALLLLNFSNQFQAFTQAQSSGGTTYLFLRFKPIVKWINGFQVENLTVDNGLHGVGPFVMLAPQSRIDQLQTIGGRTGLTLGNNCFESTIRLYTHRASVNTFYGLAFALATGVVDVDRPFMFGGRYQIVVASDAPVSIRSGWLESGNDTKVSVLFACSGSRQNNVIDKTNTSTETGGQSIEALILSANCRGTLALRDNGYESLSGAPAIKILGGEQVNISGGGLVGPASGYFLSIPIALSAPVQVQGTVRSNNQPWSDNMSQVVTPKLEAIQ